ncbi:MAG: hypothetical protein AAGD22_03930 [Verrucomicrobiota bacterium]
MPPNNPSTPPDPEDSLTLDQDGHPRPVANRSGLSPNQVFTKKAAPPSVLTNPAAATAAEIDASLRKLRRTVKVISLILLAIAGITAIALYSLFAYRSSKSPAPPTLSDNPSKTPDGQATIVNLTAFTPQMRSVVETFSTATSIDDLLKICRDPERVAPLIHDHYSRNSFQPMTIKEFALGDSLVIEQDQDSGREFVYVGYETSDFNSKVVCLEIVDGQFKLDWESAVGYCEMSWDDFKQTRPPDPTLFRIVAMANDYYNYEFDDAETWAGYSILDGQGNPQLYGFVRRDSAEYEGILTALNETQSAWLVVRLKFPENAQSNSCVEITDVVHDRWVLGLHVERLPPLLTPTR